MRQYMGTLDSQQSLWPQGLYLVQSKSDIETRKGVPALANFLSNVERK